MKKMIQNIVSKEIARCQEIAKFRYRILLNPTVKWDLKSKRVLGRAMGATQISLNLRVAEITKHAYKEVIGHEFVHCLVAQLIHCYGGHPDLLGDLKGGHGRGWKNVMKIFKLKPTRTCSAKLVKLLADTTPKSTTFSYQCSCCGENWELSKIRHNRAQKPGVNYLCKCRNRLKFKD